MKTDKKNSFSKVNMILPVEHGKVDTEHKEYVKQEWERVNSLVDTLTLFDDELMGRVFEIGRASCRERV